MRLMFGFMILFFLIFATSPAQAIKCKKGCAPYSQQFCRDGECREGWFCHCPSKEKWYPGRCTSAMKKRGCQQMNHSHHSCEKPDPFDPENPNTGTDCKPSGNELSCYCRNG